MIKKALIEGAGISVLTTLVVATGFEVSQYLIPEINDQKEQELIADLRRQIDILNTSINPAGNSMERDRAVKAINYIDRLGAFGGQKYLSQIRFKKGGFSNTVEYQNGWFFMDIDFDKEWQKDPIPALRNAIQGGMLVDIANHTPVTPSSSLASTDINPTLDVGIQYPSDEWMDRLIEYDYWASRGKHPRWDLAQDQLQFITNVAYAGANVALAGLKYGADLGGYDPLRRLQLLDSYTRLQDYAFYPNAHYELARIAVEEFNQEFQPVF
jgi:hypothetical protein